MNITFPFRKQIIYSTITAALVLTAGGLTADPEVNRDAAYKHDLIDGELIATGVRITPTAAPGSVFEVLDPEIPDAPEFRAGQGVTTTISPDGKTLLVLTSGYNYWADEDYNTLAFDEYVFVYDISSGMPVKTQVLTVPNSFMGIAWNPNGEEFYVAGGVNDNVHVFRKHMDAWKAFGAPIDLGHAEGIGLDTDDAESISWLKIMPLAAGLAVNASGDRLLVANMENDSVSLINLSDRSVLAELDLRPGKNDPSETGVPGGEFPYWVNFKGDDKAYVSSLRDREILILDLAGDSPSIAKRLPVKGNPGRMLLNKTQSRLFVALDNQDAVAMIDTDDDEIRHELDVNTQFQTGSAKSRYTGSHPNDLALSSDEGTLYVTLGGTNAVAVVDLKADKEDEENEKGKRREEHDEDESGALIGLIPTGWYPGSVSLSADGRHMYIINALSSAGPNPEGCRSNLEPSPSCKDGVNTNQYIMQLRLGGLLSMPLPDAKDLKRLTRQVLYNNSVLEKGSPDDLALMRFLRKHIKHVIYIVKENRTYDQVLGDLEMGNGDPDLTLFPEPISPNHHALARQFVTLDNTYASGAVSGDGWVWSTAGRASDFTEKTITVNYAGRGLSYDYEGMNRNINVAQETTAERQAVNPFVPDDEDVLPGTADTAALDGPDGEVGKGYLWDVVQEVGLTVRNYAFYGDWTLNYLPEDQGLPPLLREPSLEGVRVFYPAATGLMEVSSPYYREYDMLLADYWRFKEWEREYDQFVEERNMPNLMTIELPHDHFGSFGSALDGVDTPETQMADNDYALGMIVEKVANGPYKDSTLIFVIEDDTQNGPDHVDAQRTVAFVVGPYVKQGDVVSEHYTTVSMLRTIVDILGAEPMGLQVALAEPMAAVFTKSKSNRRWDYIAIVPEVLRTTDLPLPPPDESTSLSTSDLVFARPRRTAQWWEERTQGQDFKRADNLDADKFNRVLWAGLKGEDVPYPVERHGRDLSKDRKRLLSKQL
jgi:DNA-binding beta-propeller fold protein YncE